MVSFSTIIGQARAKAFLKKVLEGKNIPHAYLFTGIPGIGKTTSAVAFAASLNCTGPSALEACGRCPSCRQLAGGNFPDFLTISPDGRNIKIEQIRKLNRLLHFAPAPGPYRICVIHRAETMTDEAANSFLKTLEEPPPGNILILQAIEPRDLLPTIVSRCQRVSFQPLPFSDISKWLVEKEQIDEETALILPRIARGSLGRALSISKGDLLNKRQSWISALLSLYDLPKHKAVEMAFDFSRQGGKKQSDHIEYEDPYVLELLSVWETWYRDLLILKAGGSADLMINMDYSQKLKKTANRFTIETLVSGLMVINSSQREIKRMRNTALVMEHCVLELVSHIQN